MGFHKGGLLPFFQDTKTIKHILEHFGIVQFTWSITIIFYAHFFLIFKSRHLILVFNWIPCTVYNE